jgi:hypothetical protein
MKRLWLILFVIVPLIGQENPCENEEFKRLLNIAREYILNLNDEEFDSYVEYRKKCREYRVNTLKVEASKKGESEGKRKKTREETIEENKEWAKSELVRIEREKARIEREKTPEQRYYERKEKEQSQRENAQVLQHLLNIYQDYNQETQSPLFNSVSKPKCQYDGYELKNTFESKPYEPGDNLKTAYKWKCLSGHEYWIVK